MSNILPFRVMTVDQAAAFRDESETYPHKIEPLAITVGVHKGKFAVRAEIADNPLYAQYRLALEVLPLLSLDADVVFAEQE